MSQSAKVVRLLAEGRVRPTGVPVEEYHVDGDTPGSRYSVFIGASTAVCTCPHTGSCSHLAAVEARVNATPGERALMDEAIDYRVLRPGSVAS